MSLETFKKKHLPNQNKTVLEKEKEARIQVEEDTAEVNAIAESDKAFDSLMKEQEASSKALEDEMLNFLGETKSFADYRDRLAAVGLTKLASIEFSKGWEYVCLSTDGKHPITIGGKSFETKAGILVVLKAPDGTYFARAMGVTYDPTIDFVAITTLVLQAENSYDHKRKIILPTNFNEGLTQTESGLFIPKE
jgi:hypothetical protein